MSTLGVVIIGRNEGERLVTCLQSVHASSLKSVPTVYVDSHSTDDSVAAAQGLGAAVVVLDAETPFTAARARNAGAAALFAAHPEITYVQFLDGDTELDPKWLAHAAEYLDRHATVAVVCGRLRERHPEQSLYNLLGDMEWDGRAGPVLEFGGIAMIRASIFQKLGGYNAAFIAGEEPDLAARMRLYTLATGRLAKIVRLNHQMALHDLAMRHFSQWWKRSRRSGHALAQLHHAHGRRPLLFYRKQFRSTWVWAVAVPAVIVLLALLVSVWALVLLPLAYGALAMRITRYRLRQGDRLAHALPYGVFTTIAKFPQMLGLITFYRNHRRGRQTALIEYKGPGSGGGATDAGTSEGVARPAEGRAPPPANPTSAAGGNR